MCAVVMVVRVDWFGDSLACSRRWGWVGAIYVVQWEVMGVPGAQQW